MPAESPRSNLEPVRPACPRVPLGSRLKCCEVPLKVPWRFCLSIIESSASSGLPALTHRAFLGTVLLTLNILPFASLALVSPEFLWSSGSADVIGCSLTWASGGERKDVCCGGGKFLYNLRRLRLSPSVIPGSSYSRAASCFFNSAICWAFDGSLFPFAAAPS